MNRLPLEPIARHSDPSTAHEAAAVVKSGSAAMNEAIMRSAAKEFGRSAFRIAEIVEQFYPGRWDSGSIRTAVSRLGKRGLLVKAGTGKSPRRRDCDLWKLP